jgi:hypothetical protein
MVGCRGIRIENASKMDSIRESGTSKTLPVDLDETRLRHDDTKVGSVGVVISRIRV